MGYKASVIIPVYNAEKTVRRCVESIVYGQEREVKVILIEDCSSDDSWKECQKLSDEFENVICIQNERNSGVSYTRNHGLKHIEGEYVLFVDSDDWVSEFYVKELLDLAERFRNSFVFCGFHFIDKVESIERDYLYGTPDKINNLIEKKDYFELNSKTMIHFVWNKVFRKEIIEKKNIRFDETQSMGEDFLFVLDYMKAAMVDNCISINKPLYYYIRANSNSLMSKFGLSGYENELVRYKKLYELCGNDDSDAVRKYKASVESLKQNFIYQITHSNLQKKQQLDAIEKIMKDGKANTHYRKNRTIFYKEKIYKEYNYLRQMIPRIKGKIKSIQLRADVRKQKQLLLKKDFTLISQNCIGGVFYHDMGMHFASPTINLFFEEPDFLKYVADLKHYNSIDMKMAWKEMYPVGYLDDVCVHFMHYDTCQEAKEVWNKRKTRINYDNIIVICTDRDGFNEECFKQWKELTYKKVLFTCSKKYSGIEGVVFYENYVNQGQVPDLIPKREFYREGTLMRIINS